MREFVQEPMKTRSSSMSLDRAAGLEVHVAQRPLLGLGARLGDLAGDLDDLAGVRAPGDHRRDRRRVDLDLGVEAPRRRRSGARASARPPPRSPSGAPRRPSTHSKVVSSGAIMPARPPPSIVMLQIVIRFSIERPADRLAGVLDRVADHAAHAEPADRRQDQVLGRDPEAELARVGDPHRLRPPLDQALGGEHVLDLGGADPEGERAEGAVGGGVAVAADDRHPGLGQPELGADHVHDPLAVGAERVDRDAELLAVALQRLDLHARELVGDQPRGGVPSVGTLWSAVATCGRAGGPCAPRCAAPRRPAAR